MSSVRAQLFLALVAFSQAFAACNDDGAQVGDAQDVVQDTEPDSLDATIDSGRSDVANDTGDDLDSEDAVDVDAFDVDLPRFAPAPCVPIEDSRDVVSFTVPSGARSFQVSIVSPDEQPRIDEVVAPEDATFELERHALLLEQQRRLSDDVISALATGDETGSFAGSWSVRLEEPPGPNACLMLSTQVDRAQLPKPPGGEAVIPELLVSLVLPTGTELENEDPALDPGLLRMIASAGRALGEAGLDLRVWRWVGADEAALDFTGIVADEESLDALLRTSERFCDPACGKSVVVYLVDGFSSEFSTSGGIIVGRVGAIPGAQAVPGSDAGALAVSIEGVQNEQSADYLGKVLAHELAHFLGLTHTTQLSGTDHDALDDTPECGADIRRQARSCPDATNLMFPVVFPETSTTTTDAQRTILQSHPFVVRRGIE